MFRFKEYVLLIKKINNNNNPILVMDRKLSLPSRARLVHQVKKVKGKSMPVLTDFTPLKNSEKVQ